MNKILIYFCLAILLNFGCTTAVVPPDTIYTVSLAMDNVVNNNVEFTSTCSISPNDYTVSSVDFYIDGVLNKTIFISPFILRTTFSDLKTGDHTIVASVNFKDGSKETIAKTFKFKVKLGDDYGGGVVIILKGDSIHGVIASKNDLLGGTFGLFLYGSYSNYLAYSMDDGLSNTNKFVGKFDGGYAAIACLNHEENGYDDWYLPAYNELKVFDDFLTNLNMPQRSGKIYWSSTESSVNIKSAYVYGFGVSLGNPFDKQKFYYVRPVRAF